MQSKLASILLAAALSTGVAGATGLSGKATPTHRSAEMDYTVEKLQRSEQSQAYWQQLDRDQDRTISRQEAAKVPGLLAQWKYLDSDHNGRLDPAEFTAYETY